MEIKQLFRGRLIDHVQLVVSDLEESRVFYSAVLKILGIPVQEEQHGFFWADELVVSSKNSPAAQGKLTGTTHLAFQAKDRAMVDAAYGAGLEAGGKNNGKPGERKAYHPGYYAAFLLDPDGNNIEVVYHGKAKRSAEAIKITF